MIKNTVFDFDGTIANLFSKKKMQELSNRLSEGLSEKGFPDYFGNAFEILDQIWRSSMAPSQKNILLSYADGLISYYERRYALDCEPVEGAVECLEKLHREGFGVGIVTNNSESCVNQFIKTRLSFSPPVVGRNVGAMEKMKPRAFPIIELASFFGCGTDRILLIGDSLQDYYCSVNSGCRFAAMAQREGKTEKFLEAGLLDDRILSSCDQIYKLIGKMNSEQMC